MDSKSEMPQPIRSKLRGEQNTDCTAKLPIIADDYPKDALAMAFIVVASWSSVETEQLDFFLTKSGGLTNEMTRLFLSLATKTAKNDVIRAIVERKLDEKEKEYFSRIMKIYSSLRTYRDSLCHWQLHTSEKLFKEGLILKNPVENEKGFVREMDRVMSGNEPDFHSHLKGYYVFSMKEMRDQADKMSYLAMAFGSLTWYHHHKNPEARQEALSRLERHLSLAETGLRRPDDDPSVQITP